MKLKFIIVMLVISLVFVSGCITIVNEGSDTDEKKSAPTGGSIVKTIESPPEEKEIQYVCSDGKTVVLDLSQCPEEGISKEEAKQSVIDFFSSLGENFYEESSFISATKVGNYWKIRILEDGTQGTFEVNRITGEVDYVILGGVRVSAKKFIN